MSETSKPAIADWQLAAAETFQYLTRNSRLGRRVVEKVTGSDSPNYQQLLWLPPWKRRGDHDLAHPLDLEGDTRASGYAGEWDKVAVIGLDISDFYPCLEDVSNQYRHRPVQEAVAYVSAKQLHVGIMATEAFMFGKINDQTIGFAPRLGKGDVTYYAGIYITPTRHFTSVPAQIIEPCLPVTELPAKYPSVPLI